MFDCEQMQFGLYGENMFDTTKVTEEEKPKDDDPIIPKDKDDDKALELNLDEQASKNILKKQESQVKFGISYKKVI